MIMNIFENRDEILREQLSPNELIHELAKNQKTLSKEPIECNFYESADDVPDPIELSPEQKNLMIFDNLLLQKQNKCEAYYVRGRHSNCDGLHLSQNYFKLPHQTIRENANFFCLFPQDQKNIDHIFNDHVSQDMTKEQFKKLWKAAWSKPHNFVVIDLTSAKHNGKYRSGFDHVYIIEKMSNTEILEKIERNTSPKTSTQIVVSENSTNIKTTFNPPIELDRTRKYEMALVNLETYIRFRICLMKTAFFNILPVSLKSVGEVARVTQHDKGNGLKFKFQKAVTISLILRKQATLRCNEMGITTNLLKLQQTPTL